MGVSIGMRGSQLLSVIGILKDYVYPNHIELDILQLGYNFGDNRSVCLKCIQTLFSNLDIDINTQFRTLLDLTRCNECNTFMKYTVTPLNLQKIGLVLSRINNLTDLESSRFAILNLLDNLEYRMKWIITYSHTISHFNSDKAAESIADILYIIAPIIAPDFVWELI